MSENLSFYAHLFLNLPKRHRAVIKFLFFYHKKYPASIFPKISKIAEFCKCSERWVQKFFKVNSDINNLFFNKKARFEKSKRQTTNLYILETNLIKALEWLEIYGFLNAPKYKVKSIILSMEKQEKVHPPIPQKVHPSSKDLKIRKESLNPERPKEFINPKINMVKIPLEDKIRLSRYPEQVINLAIEDAIAFQGKGNIITTPVGYLQSRINRNLERYGNL